MIMKSIGVRMNKETIIDYSYVLLDGYHGIEDKPPNFNHSPAIKVSNQGTLLEFLEILANNSKIDGVSIKAIDFKVVET